MYTELFSFGADSDEVAAELEIDDMAETTGDAPLEGEWEAYLPRLRARFPGTKDGTLFCVFKIEQDPDITFRDFRAEAELRGIALSGRSLHGAKVLLGLEAPVKRRSRVVADDDDSSEVSFAPVATPARKPRTATALPSGLEGLGGDFEDTLRAAVEQAAEARTDELRTAIREAIAILQRALDA